MLDHEFTQLVRDARQFIENQLRGSFIPKDKESPALPLKKVEQTKKVHVQEVKAEAVQQETSTSPKIPSPVAFSGNWELHPMPPSPDTQFLRHKIAAYTQTRESLPEVLLVLPEENALHRLFLENVSRAITRSFASASVVLPQDKIFQEKKATHILAPLALLKKKFPAAEAHQPFNEGKSTWLPLENLDLYNHDVNSKRALWMSIQHLFRSSSI